TANMPRPPRLHPQTVTVGEDAQTDPFQHGAYKVFLPMMQAAAERCPAHQGSTRGLVPRKGRVETAILPPRQGRFSPGTDANSGYLFWLHFCLIHSLFYRLAGGFQD